MMSLDSPGVSCIRSRPSGGSRMKSRCLSWILVGSSLGIGACGHSDDEFNAQVRQVQSLRGQLNALTAERSRLNEQLARLRVSNENMANRLRALGEDVTRLQANNAQTQS